MDKQTTAECFMQRFSALMKLTRPKRYGSYTRGEMLILSYLYDTGEPAQPRSLCSVMDASSARVAAALRQLETKGQVERVMDASDRRRVFVHITPLGRQVLERRRREVHDYFAEILRRLGEDDVREGMRILGRIMTIAESLEVPAADNTEKEGDKDAV